MTKKISIILATITILGLSAFMAAWFATARNAEASIDTSGSYLATTTAASNLFGAKTSASYTITAGSGQLGSVIITGATAGVWNIYDATTTNVSLRASSMSTSSILIASFPASLAAGTYVFDAQFVNGLTYDVFSGSVPTTTITWKH